MDTLAFDFETYYDPAGYSLSKMTSTEYIRDSRFQAICCSFKFNDQPTHLAWGEDIGKAFNHYGTNVRAICHNAQFDCAIAATHYKWFPDEITDTLGLARSQLRLNSYSLNSVAKHLGFGEKLDGLSVSKGKRLEELQDYERDILGEYCIRDIELTKRVYDLLIQKFPKFEFLLLQWTIKAVTTPMLAVDYKMLDQYVVELDERREQMLKDAGITIEVIMSNPKFAEALRNLGVEPPMKTSPRTGKPTYAFSKQDKGITDLLSYPDVKVQAIVTARLKLKSTIEQTRAERLSAIGKTGLLPVPLIYYGAHTGRMSGGGGINLQNLTRGSKLRKGIIAPPGKALVVGDSSQIEARALAYVAGQKDLMQVFRDGLDPYCDMASFIYGRTITKSDENERWLGKVTVLGAGYGMSAKTFFEFLRTQGKPLTMDMCERAINAYRKKNDRIVQFWDTCDKSLPMMVEGLERPLSAEVHVMTGKNTITLPTGLPLFYPDLSYSSSERRYSYAARGEGRSGIYGGLITENIVQALARHIVMEQLLIVHQRFPVALTVHDELVAVVDEKDAEEARDYIETVMSTPPKWWVDLPVKAEVKFGTVYGEIK